jgi:hypothetical protein
MQTQYTPYASALKDRLNKGGGNRGGKGNAAGQGRANPVAPVPYSGTYDSTVAGLNQNLSSTQADLAGQGLALDQQYGFGADQSNPYSVARQLERKSMQERTGITNSQAASGQLYAGSTSNAFNAQAYGAGQEQDAALRDYLAKKSGIASQGVTAQNTYEQGANTAYAQKLQDALNQAPDPQEATQAPNGSGGGGGGQGGNQQGQGGGQNQGNNQQGGKPKKGEYNATHEHGKPIKKGKGR